MGLGVIRSLGRRGVPIVTVRYDEEDMGHVSRHVVERVRAPHPSQDPEGFAGTIRGLRSRYGGGLLVPASDAALVAISRFKSWLAEDFVVACPDPDVTEQFIDKERTYALAQRLGVTAPPTFPADSPDAAVAAAAEVGFPCLVKPAVGHTFTSHFGSKMFAVSDEEALVKAFGRADEVGVRVMIQEFIPGPDRHGVNYNAYLIDGEVVAQFTSRKVRNAPPRYGSPRVAVSEEIPEVVGPSLRLLAGAGYSGFANVEFKFDERSGRFMLMEVNARHNLSSLLAVRCGVDFPWFEYDHLINGVLPPPSRAAAKPGVYWIDLTRDVACNLRFSRQEDLSLVDYMRPYFSRPVFAIWRLDDPLPMLARLWLLTRRGVRRMFDRSRR